MENDRLKKDLKFALQKSNDNEQYSRLEAIRIYGIQENPNEVCRHIVCELFQNKLGLDISPRDITKIHRLDRRLKNINKPRPIILRFISHVHKSACITNRKKFRNTGIVIIEDLTQTNYQVLNRAQNHDVVANTWSYEGKLYAKLKNGAKIRLYAYENTDDLIQAALRLAFH